MKLRVAVIAVIFLLPLAAVAQDTPKAEVYGGYQFLRTVEEGVDGLNFHGFLASVEGNLNQNVGIVGEVGYGRNGESIGTVDASLDQIVFMAGPRFSVRTEKVRVFAHALFGADRIGGALSFSDEGASFDASGSMTKFAMAFGGGLDLAVNESISVRPVQFDFIPTNIGEGAGWLNQVRYSGGIVFKLGGSK